MSHSATRPHTRLRTVYEVATAQSPRWISATVSIPNAEKVVNPPRKPVNSRRRASALKKSYRPPKPRSSPATKQPKTLTVNVPVGNFHASVWWRTSAPSLYRATDPTAPPIATSNISFMRASPSFGACDRWLSGARTLTERRRCRKIARSFWELKSDFERGNKNNEASAYPFLRHTYRLCCSWRCRGGTSNRGRNTAAHRYPQRALSAAREVPSVVPGSACGPTAAARRMP